MDSVGMVLGLGIEGYDYTGLEGNHTHTRMHGDKIISALSSFVSPVQATSSVSWFMPGLAWTSRYILSLFGSLATTSTSLSSMPLVCSVDTFRLFVIVVVVSSRMGLLSNKDCTVWTSL